LVSQPLASGAVVLQSAQPAAQPPVYLHTPLLHEAPVLCAVSHATPQPPQFAVVDRLVSQPLASGAVVLQSAQPSAQPVYVHTPLLHLSPALCVVSHAVAHDPQ
jgi:hypothetical protein